MNEALQGPIDFIRSSQNSLQCFQNDLHNDEAGYKGQYSTDEGRQSHGADPDPAECSVIQIVKVHFIKFDIHLLNSSHIEFLQ